MTARLLIPWRNDVPSALARLLFADGPEALAKTTLVTPATRLKAPVLAALAALPGLPKPCVSPAFFDLSGLIRRLAAVVSTKPGKAPSRRDLLAATLGLLDELAQDDPAAWAGFAPKGGALSPLARAAWAERTAVLLEERLGTGAREDELAEALGALAGEESDFARRIPKLAARFEAKLGGWGLATESMLLKALLADPQAVAARFEGRRLLLAGFFPPTGLRERLFHLLETQAGAQIVVVADPALAEPGALVHPACLPFADWALRRGARHTLLEAPEEAPAEAPKPAPLLLNGSDLHSQLSALSALPAAFTAPGAVILAPEDALDALLAALPPSETPADPAIGASLSRTGLFRLLLAATKALRDGFGRSLAAADLLALLQNPLLGALDPPDSSTETPSIRSALRALSAELADAGRHVRVEAVLLAAAASPGPLAPLLEDLLLGLAAVPDAAGLAGLLDRIATRLSEADGAGFLSKPLEAEALHRLRFSVIPALRQGPGAARALPARILWRDLDLALAAETVPFVKPKTPGVVVMTFEQADLVSAKALTILDATEQRLPGPAPDESLLSSKSREHLGFPSLGRRAAEDKWRFHRLLKRAGQVAVLTRTAAPEGFFERQTTPSRFVEELVFAEESRLGRLSSPENPILVPIIPSARPTTAARPGLPAFPEGRERIRSMLAAGLGVTSLEAFLRCPAAFWFSRALKLKSPDKAARDGDAGAVGQAVHAALDEGLKPFLGKRIGPEALDPAAMFDLFTEKLRESGAEAGLGRAARFRLATSIRAAFSALARNAKPALLVSLEDEHRLPVAPNGTLSARIDRIEEREDTLWLLDYKTGRFEETAGKVWQDQAFFETLDRLGDDGPWTGEHDKALLACSERVKSLQTLVYSLMGRALAPGRPVEAAYVDLADEAAESPFLKPRLRPLAESLFTERGPALLRFLVKGLFDAPVAKAHPSPRCVFCDYDAACKQLVAVG